MIRDIGYLKIMKTGPGTSVQDKGRIGYSEFGIPISGVLDERSYSWVNHLLKNDYNDAALEILQPGLSILFDSPTLICLAGARSEVRLNGESISSYGIIEIHGKAKLEIGAFYSGSILYMGIKSGFQTAKILNSRSWFDQITDSTFVKKGDQIPYFSNQEVPSFTASKVKWDLKWSSSNLIEVYPGPEWNLVDHTSQEEIESMEFTISALKNRMAVQLVELLPNAIPEMATAPVFPGTVQLTSGGKIMILMNDAQITGGYPRILQLTDQALSILAQKNPNQKIRFRLKGLA